MVPTEQILLGSALGELEVRREEVLALEVSIAVPRVYSPVEEVREQLTNTAHLRPVEEVPMDVLFCTILSAEEQAQIVRFLD
jgi:hypothetical protein